MTKPFTFLVMGVLVAQAVGGPIAAGFLAMDGLGGLQGEAAAAAAVCVWGGGGRGRAAQPTSLSCPALHTLLSATTRRDSPP
jgi:hypothetical protein